MYKRKISVEDLIFFARFLIMAGYWLEYHPEADL